MESGLQICSGMPARCRSNARLNAVYRPFSKLEKINFSFRGIASEFILPDFAVDFVDASQMATPSEALADSVGTLAM